jgi:hypothetical protein
MKSIRFLLPLLAISLAANIGLLWQAAHAEKDAAETARLRADLARVQAEFLKYRETAAAENKRVVDEANAALTAAADKVISDFVDK